MLNPCIASTATGTYVTQKSNKPIKMVRLFVSLQQRHLCNGWFSSLHRVEWGNFPPQQKKRKKKKKAKCTIIAYIRFCCSDTSVTAFCMRFYTVWIIRQIRYSSCKNTVCREWCAVQLQKYGTRVTLHSTLFPQEFSLLGQRGKDSHCQHGAARLLGDQDTAFLQLPVGFS